MKKKGFLTLIALGVLGVFWWLYTHQQTQIIARLPAVNTQTNHSLESNQVERAAQKKSTQLQTTAISKPAISDAVMEYVKKTEADSQYDWKQPINFYGKVVDGNNEPIISAIVNFEWNDMSPTGTSKKSTTSDTGGFFSLVDQKGKRLYIDIGKEGYYSMRNATFEYANPADGLFIPDPNNPVVFHLRKKGIGVDLVQSQNGMLRIAPPTNGTPVFFDFSTQKIADNGQLEIEGWKERKNHQTGQNNWGFRLTVPDGGLIEENDEFPFEAPDTNYQSVVEWRFQDGQSDWRGFLKKNFYIKFGSPPRYGTITLQTGAFTPTVYLGFSFNPDGSRNLEPK